MLAVPACYYTIAQPVAAPVAARYLPLGAYSKNIVDVYAARSNAAALAHLPQSSLALYAERRFALANLNQLSFSGGVLTGKGAFALHGAYFGYNLFSQSSISLAYGLGLSEKIDVGAQFHYHSLRQAAGYGNTSSINASAGAIFHLTEKIHAGINIYNPIGSKWSKTEEKIPAQYTLGLGYEVSDKVFISTEVVKEENLSASVNAGLEYRFNQQFFIRGGISTATSSYFGAISFLLNTFRVDVAASYQAPLGVSPGILLLFNLGKKREEATTQTTTP